MLPSSMLNSSNRFVGALFVKAECHQTVGPSELRTWTCWNRLPPVPVLIAMIRCLSWGRDCHTSVLQRHSKTKSCWWVLCPQRQRWGQCSLRLEPGKAQSWYRRYLQCHITTLPQKWILNSLHPALVFGITISNLFCVNFFLSLSYLPILSSVPSRSPPRTSAPGSAVPLLKWDQNEVSCQGKCFCTPGTSVPNWPFISPQMDFSPPAVPSSNAVYYI